MSKIFVLTKFRVNKFQFVSLLVISLHVFFFPIYVNIKLVYLFLDNFIRTLHVICIIFDITTIRIKNLPHMEQHHPLLSLDHNLVWYDHSEKKRGGGWCCENIFQLCWTFVFNIYMGVINIFINSWLISSGLWSIIRLLVSHCVSVYPQMLTYCILYNLYCLISILKCCM